MLFSSADVADFINQTFEPVWESVRPAPLVTIDFGNGTIVTRTLQGNVATYVCDADGFIFDVLPGVYAPDTYKKQLRMIAADLKVSLPKVRNHNYTEYHRVAARLIPNNQPPENKALAAIDGVWHICGNSIGGGWNIGGNSQVRNPQAQANLPGAVRNGGIEGPLQRTIAGKPVAGQPFPNIDLGTSDELRLDTQVNETIRRAQIHNKLVETAGAIRPETFKSWLYKEVLHADLADPMLGLGPVLNTNYPFVKEDAALKR